MIPMLRFSMIEMVEARDLVHQIRLKFGDRYACFMFSVVGEMVADKEICDGAEFVRALGILLEDESNEAEFVS